MLSVFFMEMIEMLIRFLIMIETTKTDERKVCIILLFNENGEH